jgi:ADP-ribosylglycohydrolase
MGKNGYYGAIIGDIVGSVFEETERAASDFPIFSKRSHFTDDTVLTWATMELMLKGRIQKNDQRAIAETYREWAKRFPNAGYGWNFIEWIDDPDMGPYASKGNGAAMRVSPVAYFSSSEKECLRFAEISSSVTHNSPEGVNSAKAIALMTYQALQGASKEQLIKTALSFYPETVKGYYSFARHPKFTALASDTVPEALAAFIDSDSYEDCIKKAVLLGGDTDTLASMAGSIAGPFYGIDESLVDKALERIDDERALETLSRFSERFGQKQ